jgi:hypothetical protein
VKLTIETAGSIGADVKHKVFWVTGCAAPNVSPTVSVSPTGSVAPSGSETVSPSEGTTTTTVGGISGTNTSGSNAGGTAFTGPEEAPWLIAAALAFLLAGTLALRVASSRPAGSRGGDRRA